MKPICAAVILALLCVWSQAALADSTDQGGLVWALVQDLSDPDASVRTSAERRLIQLGDAARAELRRASESDDPELAGRAAHILGQLPWYREDDPADAARLLRGYGAMEPGARVEALNTLYAQGHLDIVLRILRDEPGDTVRWSAAARLADDEDPDLLAKLRAQDPAGANSAVLVLLGLSWWDADRDKALELLERAVEQEAASPTMDPTGQLDQVAETLVFESVRRQRPDDAARLLRQWIGRGSGGAPAGPIGRLFALHAGFGPLRGYVDDLNTYGPAIGRPLAIDRISGLLWQLGLPVRGLVLAGHAAAEMSPMDRIAAAEAMLELGRSRQAELDLRLALAAPADPVFGDRLTLWAAQRLAYLAGIEERDEEAAHWLAQLIALQERSDLRLPMDQPIQAELHWRRMRAARSRGDQAAAKAELDILLDPAMRQIAHADIILDMVPVLREQGGEREAQRLFDAAERRLRAQINADAEDPEPLNNLAWLLARSDQKLEEALALAKRAIELDPENPAFIDTAAEAHFRNGNAAEAVRLEQRALELRPGDTFMRKQLGRFRGDVELPASDH